MIVNLEDDFRFPGIPGLAIEESALEVVADVAGSSHYQCLGWSLLQRSPPCLRVVHVCIPARKCPGASGFFPTGSKH